MRKMLMDYVENQRIRLADMAMDLGIPQQDIVDIMLGKCVPKHILEVVADHIGADENNVMDYIRERRGKESDGEQDSDEV